jgi:hypothetical protein
MSSYFSNTEYHLEHRRQSVSSLHGFIEQGNRSALATSVGYGLYNSESFTNELGLTNSDWQNALGMTSDISGGMFDPKQSNTNTGKREAFSNNFVLGLSQTVTARVFTEFDSNVSNSLLDSRKSLKFLMGEAYRIDPTETKAYASQVVFENIFGNVLKQQSMYLEDPTKAKDNYYLDQSYQYANAFNEVISSSNVRDLEARGQETLDRLVNADLFGSGLIPVDGNTADELRAINEGTFNSKRSRAGRTITDLDFVRSKSYVNELTKGAVSINRRNIKAIDTSINNSYKQKAAKVIDDVKYQTRPGILPFVSMFEAAKESITIDTFQYQNRAISDVVVSKIYREIVGNKNYEFKVNMIVGSPVPGDMDGVGAGIFGQNILEVRKMQLLQDKIVEQVTRDLKGKDPEEINKIIEQIKGNFNIKLAGPAHHRKVYITDQVAVLGSINLTSPVGDSIFKAGSNYEMMGMFHSNKDLIKDREEYKEYKKTGNINGEGVGTYGPSIALKLKYDYDPQRLNDNKVNPYKKTVSALMYEQVVKAQKQQITTRSSQSNIKYATDIMYTLKATVDYLHTESGREINSSLDELKGKYTGDLGMTMVLDQAYLLHVNHLDVNGSDPNNRTHRFNEATSQEIGEMGKFSSNTLQSGQFRSRQDVRYELYRDIQRKNFSLIAMGISKVVVDTNNFTKQVIEPTWNYLNDRLDKLGANFSVEYGSSISGFVSAVTENNQSLSEKVGSINKVLGITDKKNLTALQMLAIASGNMAGADVSRQHSKSFSAYRYREATRKDGSTYVDYYDHIAGTAANSSNFSMNSTGVNIEGRNRYLDVNGNDPYVSDEMGAVYVNRDVFNKARNDSAYDQDFRDNIDALNLGFSNEYSLLAEEELYELKDNNKAVTMSHAQLNYGNRLDNGLLPSIEGLPYWARHSNTGDLLKLESTLREMSKGLGDAMSITRKYDRFGTPLMLEIAIMPGKLLGLNTNTSRLTYTLGMLQGTANQPGPVFFQKEGKLIYNSNFTNNTGGEISWKFGDKPGVLKHGQSAEMSSIDNTTSIFATMIGEMAYKQAISNPASKLIGVDSTRKRGLAYDFAVSLMGDTRYMLEDNKTGKYSDGLGYSNYLFDKGRYRNLANAMESRFNAEGISYLDTTRQLAGVDVYNRLTVNVNVEGKKFDINLTSQIQNIRNAKSGDDVHTAIHAIGQLLGQEGYQDLTLDVLRVNSKYNAERDLNSQMTELSRTIFDPYLQAHQVISYGAGVAASKYINYGLDAGNERAMSLLNIADVSKNPLLQTLQYARTFARDVSVYSGFGTDYEGNERFYLGGVAEGVSTQNKKGYQLESFGVRNKFPTDRNSIDILEGTGIGVLISKDKLNNSKDFSPDETDEIMTILGVKGNQRGMLFNLDPSKPAQINQRIKNALGSRLMYEVSEEASQTILEKGSLKEYNEGQRKAIADNITKLTSLLTDDKAKKFIHNYLTAEEVNLGSMFDTDVRTVLNESAYNFVLAQRKELFDKFKDLNLNETEREDTNQILNNMFRMKMISYSSVANSVGSVVGGRRDKQQFVLLQLNGGYSDHFYTNPKFRTQHYAGMPTVTTTGIKASMLDARTHVGEVTFSGDMLQKNGLVINEGDTFVYDRSVNKVVQIRADGSDNVTYVGGTGSADYLIGQIENFSLFGKPVASVKQKSISNRPGEDSVHLVLTAGRVEGGSSGTNEIKYQVSALPILQPGSGRRHEGIAAGLLFKGVGAALKGSQFEDVFTSFMNSLGYEDSFKDNMGRIKPVEAGISSASILDNKVSDVYGLINPNNLKSGFFMGHASMLFTKDVTVDGVKTKLANTLVKQNNRMLAAALISQFGLDIIVDSKDRLTNEALLNNEAVKAYKKAAIKGEFGTFIRMAEMQNVLTGKATRSKDNIFGSIPQFITNNRELVGSIRDAILTNSGDLTGLLESYVKTVGDRSGDGYVINSSDLYTRGVSAMLTAIDMFGQLKNQRGDISMVTDWMFKMKKRQNDGTTGKFNDDSFIGPSKTSPLSEVGALTKAATPNKDGNYDVYGGSTLNDPLLQIAAALGGSDNAFNMTNEEKEELANRMGIYLQQNYTVQLSLSILPGPNKDPLGKNYRAKTEMQHLLAPLEAQSKQFTKTGNIGNLAYVLGTVVAAQETGLISVGMADSAEYLKSIQAVQALDPVTMSGFFGKNFLGVYYNANENSSELIKEYRRIYKPSIRKDFDASKVEDYYNKGDLTLAEATYVDRLNREKDRLNGERNNIDPSVKLTDYAGQLRLVGQHIIEALKESAINYNLEQSKGMGTDITQPKLQVLQDTGNRTYNILMPQVIGAPLVDQMTGDVNTVFSNTQNTYIFMPGADLLNQVGSSFGDFVSDIVGKTLNMQSYFVPGTAENDVMIKVAKARAAQKNSANFNVNLSPEETDMINRLGHLGDELLQAISEASSDTLMQKAVAGHGTEFEGYVSTGIPNLSLAANMNVMPQFVNEKYGAPEGIASLRRKLFEVTAAAHLTYTTFGSEMSTKFANYQSNKQVREFTKSLGTVLDYQKQMLVRGMSTMAALELQNGVEVIGGVHNILNQIQTGKTTDTTDLDAAVENAKNSFNTVKKNLDVTGAYDKAYVASYVLANLQFAKLKAEAKKNKDLSMIGTVNDWMSERGYQDAIYLGNNHEIRDFIHNSTIKNRYSMGLDLVNHYSKELEGAMRGKHTVYRQPSDTITELINKTALYHGFDAARQITVEYIDNRIKNLENFMEGFAPTSTKNAKSEQEHFIVAANRKSVGYMINDMTNIKEQVAAYKDQSGTLSTKFLHYSLQELGYIHNSMSELDNMQNQSWRSAPYGSTESHLATLMAIRGVDQFNKMVDNLAIDDNIVRFDVDRSKSISIFSGLSFLTSNLGDFDGDNYMTLLHKVTEKINAIDDRKFVIEHHKNRLTQMMSLEESGKLQKTLANEESKMFEDAMALKALKFEMNSPDNQSKMAKDVASYMGIDSRFFRGADEGGFRSQGTINVSSMVVMLEQGKGLYSGMQGVSSEMNTRVDDLLALANGGRNDKFDQGSLDSMINRIVDSSEADNFFKALGMTKTLNEVGNSDVQDELKGALTDVMRLTWEELSNNSNRIHNYEGEHTNERYYSALVSKLHATTKASDALGKVMGAGLGIGMGESTYDVLTKTLGKAGNDILGKTYNTLLGTFVADSPIVSLYHILEGDSAQIAEKMNASVVGPDGPVMPSDVGTRFMANLQASYDKAQQLQGWNKAVQQMLRDSIKLKGDSSSVMADLIRMSEEYNTADEAKRQSLVDNMASKIGPGAGMKGLMDLNKMIHAASSTGERKDGEGTYGSIGDYNITDNQRDIGMALMGPDVNEDSLIKFKVSSSLRSISTMFNFEKEYGSLEIGKDGKLKIDDKASSNRALEKTISEGLHGFLGKDSDSKGVSLTLAKMAMGNKEDAVKAVEGLYNAVEGFNNLGGLFKGDNKELYQGYRDKAIVEQVNKFSAQMITNSNGAFGTMLYEHMGMAMNDDNMTKLNEARQSSGGLSTASLLVLSHHFSITQTKTFMGDYGSGLDRFVHLNKASKDMQKNITSSSIRDVGTSLLGGDLFNAAYRLMAQGKLSMEGASVMGRLFKAVNDPKLTNADAMGQMMSNFSGDEENAKEMAEMYKHLKHVEIQHEVTIDGKVERKNELVSDLINRQSKKTSQGFKLQAISEVAAAMNQAGEISDITYDKIHAQIVGQHKNMNQNEAEAKALADELLADNGLLLGTLSKEGKDYFKHEHVARGNDGTTRQELKVKAADGIFNIVGPALLSMIGGAIYGTSNDQAGMDAAGVIGGTLSLMGYNMPHGKGAANAAGALFRSKVYRNPDEDWATNLAKAASTEASLSLVGTYVTPKLTDLFNRNVVAPLFRHNVPIAESGVSAIIGSFVGALAMNMLDSSIQQSAGLLKSNFNQGDNNLNNRLAQMQDNLSDAIAARGEAEIDPMSSDFIDVPDKLDIPPVVVGVWATDVEFENLSSDNRGETYLVGGDSAYV